eukprot:CAMPEP_0181221340 /NCGR_PEP_ID=MMETSP1096-20121128/29345_1 /TAXON_ID=156174 ORGANISM="Chrysochromulina ericina, Strain CCMP281" /NCGR_SAMPLE_ID=MMETSP1096 /ASSEMBLY_ACC=CAM_ASM_000453 /LENGTH=69 /DNA_ID=CAMNT_0023313957 /DNA_START=257 /DNA_END=463 /DNA_ORIENTATION=-
MTFGRKSRKDHQLNLATIASLAPTLSFAVHTTAPLGRASECTSVASHAMDTPAPLIACAGSSPTPPKPR